MEENKIYSFIGLAKKAGEIAAGEGLVEASIKKRKAYLVIIAKDASPNTRKKIEKALYGNNITYLDFGTKENLGQMLGKKFFSVIAVTSLGFAEKLKEMIQQKQNCDKACGGGFLE